MHRGSNGEEVSRRLGRDAAQWHYTDVKSRDELAPCVHGVVEQVQKDLIFSKESVEGGLRLMAGEAWLLSSRCVTCLLELDALGL